MRKPGGFVALIVTALLAACGTGDGTGSVGTSPSSQTTAASESPAPSGSADQSPAGAGSSSPGLPSPSLDQATTGDIATALEDYLPYEADLTCLPAGVASADQVLDCAAETPAGPRTVATVIVLDDTGRFAFMSGAHPSEARISDYPPGTDDCATLAAAPPNDPRRRGGVPFPAVYAYWLQSGRPASMDPNDEGIPCQAHYPEWAVEQALASPLGPRSDDPVGVVTMSDIRTHGEAVASGRYGQQRWHTCEVAGTGFELTSPALPGATLTCEKDEWVYLRMPTHHIAVVDGSGAYLFAAGDWMTSQPEVFPADSTCSDLAQPRGPAVPLTYAEVVYHWMYHGRHSDLDADGDGRPCENYFDAQVVVSTYAGAIRP